MTRSLNPNQIKNIREILKSTDILLNEISKFPLFHNEITDLKNKYSKIDSILSRGLQDFETSIKKTTAQLELFDYKLLFSSEDFFNFQFGYVNIKIVSDYNTINNTKKWYILTENFTPLKSVLITNNFNQLAFNKYGYYDDFTNVYNHFIILISNAILVCKEDYI